MGDGPHPQSGNHHCLYRPGESVGAPASLHRIRWNCTERERGRAVGIYMAGTKIGSAIGVPIAAFLITGYGWRTMFIICGLSGFLWLIAWIFLAKDHDKQLPVSAENPDRELSFARLLASRTVWGILLGTFSYGYFLYFCVTWLPSTLNWDVCRSGFVFKRALSRPITCLYRTQPVGIIRQ